MKLEKWIDQSFEFANKEEAKKFMNWLRDVDNYHKQEIQTAVQKERERKGKDGWHPQYSDGWHDGYAMGKKSTTKDTKDVV